MAGTNKQVLDKAFKDFRNRIIEVTREKMNQWCWQILESAVRSRENDPNAHDFTGNLLNSIVVCLYEEGKPYAPYFASDLVPPAIRPKMRKIRLSNHRRIGYRFYPDYSGSNSVYIPTVDTNGGWGREDAEEFFASYRPGGKNMFDIVVAYTVEYANWVQMQRQTTGILQTKHFAYRTGMKFLMLTNAA